MAKLNLPLDRIVLLAFFNYSNGSLKAHPPLGGIIKILPKEYSNNDKPIKKSVKRLVSLGLLIQHPTRGSVTYSLSKDGRDFILKS